MRSFKRFVYQKLKDTKQMGSQCCHCIVPWNISHLRSWRSLGSEYKLCDSLLYGFDDPLAVSPGRGGEGRGCKYEQREGGWREGSFSGMDLVYLGSLSHESCGEVMIDDRGNFCPSLLLARAGSLRNNETKIAHLTSLLSTGTGRSQEPAEMIRRGGTTSRIGS